MNDPYAPPGAPLEVPPPRPPSGLRIGAVVRDVVILFVLTAIGGAVIGLAVGTSRGRPPLTSPQVALAVAVSNVLFSAVAFCISGMLTRVHRLRHLAVVAVVTWLLSGLNLFIAPFTLVHWLLGSILLAVAMLVGWGASVLLTGRDRAV